MSHPLAERYCQAYLEMASFYRPQAPGDGLGNIRTAVRAPTHFFDRRSRLPTGRAGRRGV
jgi:hypothetical protein